MARRTVLGIGAVGGGLLAAAFLPMGAAVADEGPGSDSGAVAGAAVDGGTDPIHETSDGLQSMSISFEQDGSGYTLTPSGDDTVNISQSDGGTGDDGGTGADGDTGTDSGTGGTGVDGGTGDTSAGDDGGTDVHVIEHDWSIGDTDNIVYVIDSDGGEAGADGVPEDGSVFMHNDLGSGFSNDYVDLVNPDGDNDITDVLTTPFGQFEVPTDFDLASDLDPSNLADFLGDLAG